MDKNKDIPILIWIQSFQQRDHTCKDADVQITYTPLQTMWTSKSKSDKLLISKFSTDYDGNDDDRGMTCCSIATE